MILAGDIGGTKTVVALYEPSGDGLQLVREEVFASRAHAKFEEILAAFLQPAPAVSLRAGCFGVAGAVIDGRVQTTNLPWALEEGALAAFIRAPRVKLLNDLEAAAYGVLFLSGDEVCVLNRGAEPKRRGNIAVIAAGTGLGEALLYWDAAHFHPIASEGGHADFAPRTDEEIELLRYLRNKFASHVSYERVLSGPGLFTLYEFLRDARYAPESPALAVALQSGDPSATVAQHGLAGDEPLCVKTLDLFSTIYGAEAGNLALKCVGVGGVFVAGGIGPKILPVLRNGSFLHGFTNKGRFTPLMESMPVSVALNPRTPLIGAAHYALRL
jgi:glucokinase